MKLRDLLFHKEFDDFFTESFTLDSDDQKQAASEAATHISNTMILYCQAHDDPYYALNRMGGLREVNSAISPTKLQVIRLVCPILFLKGFSKVISRRRVGSLLLAIVLFLQPCLQLKL